MAALAEQQHCEGGIRSREEFGACMLSAWVES
jgi:hypothetical protein